MSSILQLIVRITLCYIIVDGFNLNKVKVSRQSQLSMALDFQPGDADILVRAFRGEDVERTPVWLMRQAGRYIADFRKYSEKFPFRERSETPDIAIELSLQPWRKFGVDGVIMFSGICFTVYNLFSSILGIPVLKSIFFMLLPKLLASLGTDATKNDSSW